MAVSDTFVPVNVVLCNSSAVRYHSLHGVGKGIADGEVDRTELGVAVADRDREESVVVGSPLLINNAIFIRCEG